MLLSVFTFCILGIEPNNFKAAKVRQKVRKDVLFASFPNDTILEEWPALYLSA
jgi:hypothetical protein